MARITIPQANPEDINVNPPSRNITNWLRLNFLIIRTLLLGGVSGTFTTADGKTVTVTKGVVTEIQE